MVLIIIFVLFLMILFLILLSYLFRDKDKNNIESFSDIIPTPPPTTLPAKKEYNNLIANGSFEYGKDSINHINQNGHNKIIMKKNPGRSSYVLEQQKSEELTYMNLYVKMLKIVNIIYIFRFLHQMKK